MQTWMGLPDNINMITTWNVEALSENGHTRNKLFGPFHGRQQNTKHILTRTKSPFCSLDPTSTSNDTNNWGRAPFHHYKGWLSPGTPRSLGKSPLVLTPHISYTTTSLTDNRVFSRVKELANRQQIPYHHKGENQTTAKITSMACSRCLEGCYCWKLLYCGWVGSHQRIHWTSRVIEGC